MKEKLYDFLTCFKLSLKIFIPMAVISAGIGAIIGLTKGNINAYDILSWVFNIGTWITSFGLFVCALAFIKPTFLSDLNHQRQWRTYFYKLNLVSVMLFVCLFIYVYLALVDLIRYFLFL